MCNTGGVTYIAETTVDLDSLFLAPDAPEIDFSDDATLVMLDDDGVAPAMAETGAITEAGSVSISDAATVAGGPAEIVNPSQIRAQALRLIQPISFRFGRPDTVHVLTGVAW